MDTAKQIDVETGEVTEIPVAGGMSVVRAQESAALDVQVSTAKAYPRSIQRFQSDLESWATLNEEIADECFYAKPQGGQTIIGPSVRFAELIQSAYGNLMVESRVIGEEDGHVIVEATCRDVERNTARRDQVRRPILTKAGKRFATHMIEQTINAASAIAGRNAIFKVVPKALWWQIYQKARQVAVGDAKTFGDRRDAALAYLKDMGATEERILHYLGDKKVKDLDADDLIALRLKVKTIKEDGVSVDDAFPAPKGPDPKQAKESAAAAGDAISNGSKESGKPEGA